MKQFKNSKKNGVWRKNETLGIFFLNTKVPHCIDRALGGISFQFEVQEVDFEEGCEVPG